MNGDSDVSLREVYNIAKGLEDRFDRRFGELRRDVKEWAGEQRRDLKELHAKIDRVDREGSIGTREELQEHERRIDENARAIGKLQTHAAVTAGEQRVFLGIGGRIAAIVGWLVAGALALADLATKIIFR